ncbi:alpha/beta fold hydrolase [Hymenobacter sp. BRD67]|uniref:alpha/beta fold hydrolase n=1 Tax=Hymenobacter sp. BRD67 TaxID=2675877 RepID=UPI003977E3ED
MGHSLGGILLRSFVAQYPAEVRGVVLVEASHPDQLRRLPAALPADDAPPGGSCAWRRRWAWSASSIRPSTRARVPTTVSTWSTGPSCPSRSMRCWRNRRRFRPC